MRYSSRRVAGMIAISAAFVAPFGPAFGQDKAPDPPTAAASPAAAPAIPHHEVQPIDDQTLSDTRGGQAIVIGNQTLKSSLTGNSIAGNYTAGGVSFSDTAFSNFSGMGNIVINTGAQANLQSAMNITINLGN